VIAHNGELLQHDRQQRARQGLDDKAGELDSGAGVRTSTVLDILFGAHRVLTKPSLQERPQVHLCLAPTTTSAALLPRSPRLRRCANRAAGLRFVWCPQSGVGGLAGSVYERPAGWLI